MLMLYNKLMKKKLYSYFVTIFMSTALVGLPVAVYAETTTDSTTTTNTSSSSEQKTRLEKYKTKLSAALTETAQTRIMARCVAAQALVKTHLKNAKTASATRTTSYDNIVKQLEAVSSAASAKGADVSTLDSDITTLKSKIATFTTDNDTFQTALDDLSALDCKDDPTAFQAALEAARTDQTSVLGDVKDIRTFLVQTIKTDLTDIRTALTSASSGTESE